MNDSANPPSKYDPPPKPDYSHVTQAEEQALEYQQHITDLGAEMLAGQDSGNDSVTEA
ncbi:MAG TPA: hypothetical protein VKR79_07635 [Gaiellaceae bacterium]|nr:hypothetical protein [Gaiellaceae bacterium]